jgi:hypothetical protein
MRKTARKLKERVEAITNKPASHMAISPEIMILDQGKEDPYVTETTPQIAEMIETLEGVTGARFKTLVVKTDNEGFYFSLKYIKDDMIKEMEDRVNLENLK